MPVTLNRKTGKWMADYVDQFRKRHRPSFETKREAKDHLITVEAEIKTNVYRPEAAKRKLSDVGREFIQDSEGRVRRQEIDKTTHHNYASIIERYVIASRDLRTQMYPERAGQFFSYPLGGFTLSELTVAHIEQFRSQLGERDLSAGTIKSIMMVVRMLLDWAKRRNLITENVADESRTRKKRRAAAVEVEIPEKAAVAALCRATTGEQRLVILLAATSGLRSSEQRALQWRHIDFEKRTVKVERRVNRFGQIGEPKTRAGRRIVPLPPIVVEALRHHRAQSRFQGRDDLVFPTRTGAIQTHANWIKRIYDPAWKRAAVDWAGAEPLQRCKWHSLRHFAISTWIEKNLPLKQVQRWAGHGSAAMTLDTYSHLFEAADHSHVIDQIADEVWQE